MPYTDTNLNTSPTTHMLPYDERQRVMRSARKLEAVLGETPLLIEAPASACHNRSMSAQPQMSYTPTATGSHRRAVSAHPQVCTGTSTRAPLVIVLPESKLDASPMPELLSSPPSPLTPTNEAVDVHTDAARRRKLAKVSHMLGENVPPALVFSRAGADLPRTSTSSTSQLELESRSSTSTFSCSSQERLFVPLPDASARSNDTHRREARQGWSGEWSGGRSKEVHTMDDVVRGLRSMRVK